MLDFVSSDAAAYGQIRARLKRAGKRIGPLDTSSHEKTADRPLKKKKKPHPPEVRPPEAAAAK